MTPLLWIFAIAAVVLGLGFAFAGLLAFRHSGVRADRRGQLASYIAATGSQIIRSDMLEAQDDRAAVMHITIGDLVRDKELVRAALEGVRARRVVEQTERAARRMQ
jgi:hypothetical protein